LPSSLAVRVVPSWNVTVIDDAPSTTCAAVRDVAVPVDHEAGAGGGALLLLLRAAERVLAALEEVTPRDVMSTTPGRGGGVERLRVQADAGAVRDGPVRRGARSSSCCWSHPRRARAPAHRRADRRPSALAVSSIASRRRPWPPLGPRPPGGGSRRGGTGSGSGSWTGVGIEEGGRHVARIGPPPKEKLNESREIPESGCTGPAARRYGSGRGRRCGRRHGTRPSARPRCPRPSPHGREILGAQRTGQRQRRGRRRARRPPAAASSCGLSHSKSPRPSLTAVSSRQPATPARARGGDQRARGQRPARRARAVGVGAGDHRGAFADRLAHRAQDRDRLVLARRAPQADLHVRAPLRAAPAAASAAVPGRCGRSPRRDADRQLGRHDGPDALDHRRGWAPRASPRRGS
jgi:hypothetical protein